MKRNQINETLTRLRNRDDIKLQDVYLELEDKYGIPVNVAASILASKRDFAEINDRLAFCFMSVLAPNDLGKYYTEKEIKALSQARYEKNVAKFPLVYDMIQLATDQWIGTITIKQLVALRDAGLVDYNPETQRPMKMVINGEEVTYRISINWSAVKQIKELILNGNYIPDDLTLNMPLDADYAYTNGKLRISEMSNFDIIDGYHRYLAICQIYNEFPDFEYSMELRITQFATEKAQQLIYQKDQKTLMTKQASKTYDQLDVANTICQRINQDARFNLRGAIGRNDSQIKMQDFTAILRKFWIKSNLSKKERLELTVNLCGKLIKDFNIITEGNKGYLGTYSLEKLFAVMFVFWKEVPDDQLLSTVDYMVAAVEQIDPKLFSGKTISTKLVNEAEALLERR